MKAIDHVPAPVVLQAPLQASEAGELDLFGIVRLIRRRIWTIIAIMVVVTGLALPGILALEPVYHAETRLMVTPPVAASLAPAKVEGLSTVRMATEIERLSSREMALQVIDTFHLDKLPEFNPELAAAEPPGRLPGLGGLVDRLHQWLPNPGTVSEDGTSALPTDAILTEFAQAASITADPSSDVITVGFRSRDPVLAAEVANGIARLYFENRELKRQQQVATARDWFDKRIAEQRQRVEDAEAAADKYLSDRGVNRAWLQQDMLTGIMSLTDRHEAAARERDDLRVAVASLQAGGTPAAGAADIDLAPLVALRQEVAAKRRELSRLLGIFNPAHAEVMRARAELQEAEDAADAQARTTEAALQQRTADVDRADRLILASIETARAELEHQTEVRRGLDGLMRAVETERGELDKIVVQERDLDSQAELPGPDVEVLAPASVPRLPEGRGRSVYLVAAVMAGGLLALSVACLRELLDSGVRSHDQLEDIPGLAPVGMVPAVRRRRQHPPARAVLSDPRGMFADALRGALVAIARGNGDGLPASLLVTSAVPSEGKSTIAAAMAIELASSGRKVLLVDCDLRRGRLGPLFHGKSSLGLGDYLTGDSALEQVIQHDRKTGVDFVASLHLSADSLRRLDRIETLIAHAKRNGQMVILDSPPVLATTEPALLAGLAERTLLVIRWGRTPHSAVELAAERLAANNRRDVFSLLNLLDPRRHALYRFRDAGMFTGSLRKYYSS